MAEGGNLTRVFLELEQHLCRVDNRTGLFRVGNTDLPDQGHHAMAGRVIREALEVLRASSLKGVPTQQRLAEELGCSPTVMGNLLNGRPPSRRNWCRDCNGLLAFLLQEVISANAADDHVRQQVGVVRDRIRHFFYRSAEASPTPSAVPSFFAFERRFSSLPCSIQELSQTIAWYARQPEVGGFRTEIVVILGNQPFAAYDPRELLQTRLRDAVLNGVDLAFILPANGTSNGNGGDAGAANGHQLVSNFQSLTGVKGNFRCLRAAHDGVYDTVNGMQQVAGPLHEAGLSFPFGHALHLRSITHARDNQDEQEVCHFLHLRNFSPVHLPPDHHPVAYPATQADRELFDGWRRGWDRPQSLAAASVPPQPVPSGEGGDAG